MCRVYDLVKYPDVISFETRFNTMFFSIMLYNNSDRFLNNAIVHR